MYLLKFYSHIFICVIAPSCRPLYMATSLLKINKMGAFKPALVEDAHVLYLYSLSQCCNVRAKTEEYLLRMLFHAMFNTSLHSVAMLIGFLLLSTGLA